MVSPGDSSVPANIDPSITEFAPAAIALGISPVKRIPPSAIMGRLISLTAFDTSIIADNCGYPTPAIILVVQIDPGPIPTFNASAPAFARSSAACPVAILPTITSIFLNFFFTSLRTVITPFECP